MAFDAGAIASTLGLDVSPFTQGMLQAQSIAKLFPGIVSDFLANPLLGVIGTFEAAGNAAESFFGTVNRQALQMNEVGEAAQKAGVSVQFLSGVGAAFTNAGSSVDGLSEALKYLNKTTGEVVSGMPGSERAAMIFARLGIGTGFLVRHLNDTEAIFNAVADAVSRINSPAERTNVLMELLSRSGSDAGNAFKEGSHGLSDFAEEMNRLGDVTDEKQASLGHTFFTLSQYVQAAFDGMEKAASRPILEAIQAHAGNAKLGIEELAQAVDGRLQNGIQRVVDYLVAHRGDIEGFFSDVGGFLAQHKADIEGVFASAGNFLKAEGSKGWGEVKEAISYFVAHKDDIKTGLGDIRNLIESLGPALKAVAEATKATFGFLHNSINEITETDADKAGGHPYAAFPNLSAASVAKAGDQGAQHLQEAMQALAAVQPPVLNVLSGVASSQIAVHGSYATGKLPFIGPSETGFTSESARNDASSENLALRARASEMRLAAMSLSRERASGGGVDPSTLEAAVKSVQAFGDEAEKAGRLLGKWQEWNAQIGDTKTTSILQAAIQAQRDAMRPAMDAVQSIQASHASIAAPVSAVTDLGRAPGAANSLAMAAEPSNGGGNFASSLIPASAALDVFSDRSRSLIGQFQSLYSTVAQLNPELGQLLARVNGVASSPTTSTQASSSRTAQSGVTINSLNLPPFDIRDASSQIAAKILPVFRDAFERAINRSDAIAHGVKTQGGL